MKKFGSALLGAVIGGIVGSAAVILFAPASGEQTRQEIADYFENFKDEVQRAADEKRAELESQLEDLRSGKDVTIEEKAT
ncbi:MAG: YtxH domain-containing protein [Chloroflexota bacterium]|nr:YtxH domain-containing protein [Chloroflexota bacterium]